MFDHGWADAFERAGGTYYPKLQVAVPFTPVPGPRLLGPGRSTCSPRSRRWSMQNGLSSAHITFIDEAGAAECERRGWLIRHGIQYHWHNRGYGDFDDFLAALTSRKRKAIRKERAGGASGLEFRALRGAEIGPAEWDAMWRFYQDTGARKWGRPYLTRDFFDLHRRARWATACCCSSPFATAGRSPARSTSSARDTLYGRYWGAVEEVPFLHFELSYYQAIEWAIDARPGLGPGRRAGRAQAGARL